MREIFFFFQKPDVHTIAKLPYQNSYNYVKINKLPSKLEDHRRLFLSVIHKSTYKRITSHRSITPINPLIIKHKFHLLSKLFQKEKETKYIPYKFLNETKMKKHALRKIQQHFFQSRQTRPSPQWRISITPRIGQ